MNLFATEREKYLGINWDTIQVFETQKKIRTKKRTRKRATLPRRFNGNMKTITHMYIAYYILVFDSPLKTGIERVS